MNSSAALVGILVAGGIGAAVAWGLRDKQQKDQAQGRAATTPPGLRGGLAGAIRSPGQPTTSISFPPGFPLIPSSIRQAQTTGVKRTGKACCATCEVKERYGIT